MEPTNPTSWLDAVGLVATAIVAVQVAASAIVAATPSDKDDAFLAKVAPWLERLTGILAFFRKPPAR